MSYQPLPRSWAELLAAARRRNVERWLRDRPRRRPYDWAIHGR